MAIDINHFRKISGSYGATSSSSKAIIDFAKDSNRIWDNTISLYDALAVTNRADDVDIIDYSGKKTHSRSVFNYEYSRNRDSFRDGYERIFSAKDSIKEGYYVKKTSDDALDEVFIVESLTRSKFLYEDAYVKRCNELLRFFNTDGKKEYPCVFEGWNQSSNPLDANENLVTTDFFRSITCQKNDDTMGLTDDYRIIFGKKNVYKIVEVEDSISDGLLYIKFQIDQKVNGDDFISGIAENGKYVVEIDQGDIGGIVGFTTLLTSEVISDGEKISGAKVFYESSDPSVVSIDQDGHLTLLKNGNAVVRAIFGNTSDSISVNVTDNPSTSIQMSMNPLITQISQGDGEVSIKIDRYINHAIDPNTAISITHTDNFDGEGYSVSIEPNNIVKITNNSVNFGYVTIHADDGIIQKKFKINLVAW